MSLSSKAKGGRYMVFRLAGETYGVAIMKVRELVGMLEVTRVPGAPQAMRGVVNLRGKVISVVDLRAKFGMGETSSAGQTVLMMLEQAAAQPDQPTGVLGVMVDEVLEVATFDDAHIEALPGLSTSALPPDYFLGVGRGPDKLVLLLDIDRVLSAQERAFASAADGAAPPQPTSSSAPRTGSP